MQWHDVNIFLIKLINSIHTTVHSYILFRSTHIFHVTIFSLYSGLMWDNIKVQSELY